MKYLAILAALFWASTASAMENYSAPAGFGVSVCTISADNDFDGDGISDVLWQNSNTGALLIYFMAANPDPLIRDVASAGRIGPEWQIEQVSDFNGDCMADILWRHVNDFRLVVWLMNGAIVESVTTLSNRANSSWLVKSK